jgi:hypothetical protein
MADNEASEAKKGDSSAKQSDSSAKQETVTLSFVDWRYEEWDFGVEGVDPIRKEGTEVPADKEEEVREAARQTGERIELKKL